jgi:hypothetical protein
MARAHNQGAEYTDKDKVKRKFLRVLRGTYPYRER